MTSERRKEIEGRAINTYGEQPQVDTCIEEMSELTKAILKYRRAENKNKNEAEYLEDDIIEEIADVQIMLDQMRIIFGDTSSQEEYKLNRLWARMEAET
jgi:NTP pyrophosphatase (non-canonical NTP hydrolase)